MRSEQAFEIGAKNGKDENPLTPRGAVMDINKIDPRMEVTWCMILEWKKFQHVVFICFACDVCVRKEFLLLARKTKGRTDGEVENHDVPRTYESRIFLTMVE